MIESTNVIFILAGLVAGALIVWLVMRAQHQAAMRMAKVQLAQAQLEIERLHEVSSERDAFVVQLQDLDKMREQLNTDLEVTRSAFAKAEQDITELKRSIEDLRSDRDRLASNKTVLEQKLAASKERHEQDVAQLKDLHQNFESKFKNLAEEILENKSKKFTSQNQENLDGLLKPLQERIQSFEKRVDSTHRESLEKQSALREQLLGLREMNQQMSKETQDLTKALKGDVKKQGNWGELILEKVLKASGLTEGIEYHLQEHNLNAEGKTVYPDVVIELPGDKRIVVDSKVSLVAWTKYVEAEEETDQNLQIRMHVKSMRDHVTGLADKNYQDLHDTASPDFVLLFVPIENAFAAATDVDRNLYEDAFSRKVIIVSPTTLLATLRTIDTMWQSEKQQRNALNIATEAGNLYDKFEGLVTELTKLGKQLNTAQNTYQDSMEKLSTGSGNLVRRVEKLRKLGAKANKSLPRSIVDRANEGEEDLEY